MLLQEQITDCADCQRLNYSVPFLPGRSPNPQHFSFIHVYFVAMVLQVAVKLIDRELYDTAIIKNSENNSQTHLSSVTAYFSQAMCVNYATDTTERIESPQVGCVDVTEAASLYG